MLINGHIWAFVEREGHAFQTAHLHGVTVVVHAHDFLVYILQTLGHAQSYGGEYALIKEELLRTLENFTKCNISPIFIFDGPTSKPTNICGRLHILQKRVKLLECALQQARPLTQSAHMDNHEDFFYIPIFAREVLVETLDNTGFPHVTCDGNAILACAAVGAFLQCPVIAKSNEFLLFEFEKPNDRLDCFTYVPLRFLSSQPVPHSLIPGAFCLIAHVFSPSESCISRIPYSLRPFFAIYYKPPQGSYFPLPSRISNLICKRRLSDPESLVHPMIQRAIELVNWLESLTSPFEALAESLDNLRGEEVVSSFIQELVAITLSLKIDLKQGEELVRFLSLETKSRSHELVVSTDLITCLTRQLPYPRTLKEHIELVEAEYGSSDCAFTSFLSKVPPTFLKFYRSGVFPTSIYTLFFSNPAILPVKGENVASSSATDCAKGLRYLQYCLLLDFTKQCGVEMLRSNNKPQISEISRSKDVSQFCHCSIVLQSLPLPASEDPATACISFIYKNFDYQTKSVSNILEILALIFKLWHMNTRPNTEFNILDCPTALGVALIVCAVIVSDGSLNVECLNELADSMKCDYNVVVIHEITELQIICVSLLSLLRFVSTITFCKNDSNVSARVLTPPLGVQIFPSSRLIHNLAVALADSPDRKSLTIWLKRLFLPTRNTECLGKAVDEMIRLLIILREMGSLRLPEFSSSSQLLPFPQHTRFPDNARQEEELQVLFARKLSICGNDSKLESASVKEIYMKNTISGAFTHNASPRGLHNRNAVLPNVRRVRDGAITNRSGPRNSTLRFIPRNVDNRPTWGLKCGYVNSRTGLGYSYDSRKGETNDVMKSFKCSTNPFLPGYNSAPHSNLSFTSASPVGSKNPFSSDFAEGREANSDLFALGHDFNTSAESEHKLASKFRNQFACDFPNRFSKYDRDSIGSVKKMGPNSFRDPSTSFFEASAEKMQTRRGRYGVSGGENPTDAYHSQRKKFGNHFFPPRAPRNCQYPKNVWSNSRPGTGNPVGSRLGGSCGRGFYGNSTKRLVTSCVKQEWSPDKIAEAAEKLASHFS